jgi:Fe-S oxidoreductase
LLHGHCYQKAQPPAGDGFPTGVPATVAMLKALGYDVELIDAGCCGMAGAFGYEAEHYDLSARVGELALFPAIRKSGAGALIAAAGTSCRSQILDGTARQAVHPVCLIVTE